MRATDYVDKKSYKQIMMPTTPNDLKKSAKNAKMTVKAINTEKTSVSPKSTL